MSVWMSDAPASKADPHPHVRPRPQSHRAAAFVSARWVQSGEIGIGPGRGQSRTQRKQCGCATPRAEALESDSLVIRWVWDERRKTKKEGNIWKPGCVGLQAPAGPRRGRIAAPVKHLADGDTPKSYRPYPETQSADKPTTSNVPGGGWCGRGVGGSGSRGRQETARSEDMSYWTWKKRTRNHRF
jgi:hypothetical protein